jgi:hypothetical protein
VHVPSSSGRTSFIPSTARWSYLFIPLASTAVLISTSSLTKWT